MRMITSTPGWAPRQRSSVWPARVAVACGTLLLGSAAHQTPAPKVAPVGRKAHSPTLIVPRPIALPKKLRRPLSSLAQSQTRAHVYRIRWGDSLWSIAEKFHVSVATLEAANHLHSTTIYAGDTLTIPTQSHTVTPGDTVESIARRYQVPILKIWHANHLTSDQLTKGQVLSVPAAKPEAHLYDAEPVQPAATISPSTVPFTHEDIRLLAHLVHAEAGNQPFLGQVAVAAVVLNRLKTPGFPKTIPEVIEEPGQFDSVSSGTFWQSPGTLAYKAVMAALNGADPTGGALFYYNPSLPYASWMNTLPVTVTIGNQVFCR
ncbi:cell wall hydrolase [Sulfobacillus sp. hq2]|nr:cell wall hydrolase [Sulfobacillus sp. hq2]